MQGAVVLVARAAGEGRKAKGKIKEKTCYVGDWKR